ncbi:L,D-transpeptidase family protein [Mesorhizobium sp. NBSH29]|uniref:L,D-transpeptidase n=1 Tax=Mesorhizobium sp. NBSH29 TaxID=2654249 RepID=UPI00189675A0|nr:L,D-transpeptidase [Mesorhizobium sp. NBSH29]QPC87169.1 L,D-transpeptidase family protein [Mesorhizobium sp. NBSH29]
MSEVANIEFSRRKFFQVSGAVAASAALAACTSVSERLPSITPIEPAPPPAPEPALGGYAQMYASVTDEGFQLPAIPVDKVDNRFLRQMVQDPTGEMPGTIVVDTKQHFLYLVRPGGQAMRYGVGLGRAGFAWSGRAVVQWKRKWPTWKVPDEMIARQPELEKYSVANGGMEPGLKNPLGSRALYIFQDGEDTLYRIHGSPEWWTIGKSVSSGCVRMINQDVMDLYDRVPNRTPIVVY